MICSTALFIVYIQGIFCVTLKQTPLNERAPALFYDYLSQKKNIKFFQIIARKVQDTGAEQAVTPSGWYGSSWKQASTILSPPFPSFSFLQVLSISFCPFSLFAANTD